MTDEEMAEQFADNINGLDLTCSLLSAKDKRHAYRLGRYDGFLAGLKAGRPQWHTPDARLPEEEGDYLFCLRDGEETTMYDIMGVSIDENGYVSLDSHIWSITDVIAWTELPTYKE